MGLTLAHAAAAERRGASGAAMKAASWNVRWMLDPHTTVAAAKRAVILRLLNEGCVVLLQETHWTEAACATWGGCFPMAEVRASAARPGANGGLSGGVAILVPARYRVVSEQLLSAGCCIEVACAERTGGATVTYRSTYLPPGSRSIVLAEIRRCGHPGTDLVVGGDVNMCLMGPRDEAEAEEAQALLEWAAEHGATALPIGGPTHRRPFGCCQLDWIAVPTQGHWEWSTQLRWFGGLSDHACVVASKTGGPVTSGRHCNPASLALLPAAAFTDLRLRYRHLGHMFGLTQAHGEASCGVPQARSNADNHDDGFRGEAGASAIIGDTGGNSCDEGGSTPGTASGAEDHTNDDIGFIPHLARHGRSMLSGMLRAWWTTWAKRRGPAETGPGTQLTAAARASGSSRPSGALLAWLGHLGAEGEACRELTPEDAARWLSVWRHEQARPLCFNHRRIRPHRGTEALRCGRPTFRQRLSVGALLHEDGQVLTEPRAITEAVAEPRGALDVRPGGRWGSACGAGRLL